ITQDNVRRELERLGLSTDRVEATIPKICSISMSPTRNDTVIRRSSTAGKTTRRKIFAILVLIHRVLDIEKFIDADILDMDLPFACDTQEMGGEPQGSQEKRAKLVEIFESWEEFVVEAFDKYQWQFLAPYFTLKGPNAQHNVL